MYKIFMSFVKICCRFRWVTKGSSFVVEDFDIIFVKSFCSIQKKLLKSFTWFVKIMYLISNHFFFRIWSVLIVLFCCGFRPNQPYPLFIPALSLSDKPTMAKAAIDHHRHTCRRHLQRASHRFIHHCLSSPPPSLSSPSVIRSNVAYVKIHCYPC